MGDHSMCSPDWLPPIFGSTLGPPGLTGMRSFREQVIPPMTLRRRSVNREGPPRGTEEAVTATSPRRVELDVRVPVWDRFFTVAPLVLVGTREPDGRFDLAPKHMVLPLGWQN